MSRTDRRFPPFCRPELSGSEALRESELPREQLRQHVVSSARQAEVPFPPVRRPGLDAELAQLCPAAIAPVVIVPPFPVRGNPCAHPAEPDPSSHCDLQAPCVGTRQAWPGLCPMPETLPARDLAWPAPPLIAAER